MPSPSLFQICFCQSLQNLLFASVSLALCSPRMRRQKRVKIKARSWKFGKVKEMVLLSLCQLNLWPPESGSTAFQGLATAASIHACHHVRRHLRFGFHLRSSLEKLQHFSDAARMEFSRYQRVVLFNGANFLKSTVDTRLSPSSSFVCFFNGGERRINPRGGEEGSPFRETSKRDTHNGRRWTTVLLVINVTMYIAQVAIDGKVLTWGAKINSLIERGQLWRLVTSSVLHANPMHLMINCYSLNSIGPTAESLGGPKRFLAVYMTSAIASSAMSYWFNQAPSVGASGAIFGLVGSVAVFVIRHKRMIRGGNEDLMQIAQVIALNMFGGLLGGMAMTWLLGPQWMYEYTTRDGQRVFMDSAPIPSLVRWRNQRRRP